MTREYWQKTAVCELGCCYYVRRPDGTEACTFVGYRLHPDWIELAPDCDDFATEPKPCEDDGSKKRKKK